MDCCFSNLWVHFPGLGPRGVHTKTVLAIRAYEKVYLEWRTFRGVGVHGQLNSTHRIQVEWENTLIENGLSPRPPQVLHQMWCYRRCGLFCANNAQVVPLVEQMFAEYCGLPCFWEQDFRARFNSVSLKSFPLRLSQISVRHKLNTHSHLSPRLHYD